MSKAIREQLTKMKWKFALAGVIAILGSATAIAQEGYWKVNPAPEDAVLYGFANINDLSKLAEGPVKETCKHSADPSANTSTAKTKPLTEDQEVKLANGVTKELSKKLTTMSVIVAQPSYTPPAGSLVFTGCFVGADSGSAAKRLVGLGLGASHLVAHVRVFYVGASGPVPVDEFDLAVKGDKKLPPIGAAGLTFNAVSEKRETLQGDSKRMADEILKRLKKDNRVVQSDDGLLVEAKLQGNQIN